MDLQYYSVVLLSMTEPNNPLRHKKRQIIIKLSNVFAGGVLTQENNFSWLSYFPTRSEILGKFLTQCIAFVSSKSLSVCSITSNHKSRWAATSTLWKRTLRHNQAITNLIQWDLCKFVKPEGLVNDSDGFFLFSLF